MANASIRRWRGAAVAGLLVAGLVVFTGRIVGQQPVPQPPTTVRAQVPVAPAAPAASPPVAYIYGTLPLSHEEFGKYLIDRGGFEKLELFVNKKIIEIEAARRNITVTKEEMEASLNEDISTASQSGTITKAQFIQVVLAKHDKTFFEWMEDVVRPRLLLRKMCEQDVKVTDEALKLQFERRYGEQRLVQIILYPPGENLQQIQATWGKIRNDAVEFDSAARAQPIPALAASLGKIKPICKHLVAQDKLVEDTAFKLKKGEVSEVLQTKQGYLVMKLLDVVPPNKDVTFEKEKPNLQRAAFDELLEAEIPKFFGKLREAAKVDLKYQPPVEWRTTAAPAVPSVIPTGGK